MRFVRNGMLRCLCLILVGLLLLPTVVNAADTTLIHRSASRSSTPMGQMAEGTILNVVEETGSFYKVDCFNMYGYIAKDQVIRTLAGYQVRCTDDSETGDMPYYAFSEALELRSQILSLAQRQLGVPYVYGGMSPSGFDCSGFVYYVYGKTGFDLMRCADEQMRNGIAVSKDGLQAGDLVFFRDPWAPWLATHVGIYVGNNQMIHASTSRGITIDSLDMPYYAERYVGARRIINVDATEITGIPSVANGARARTLAPAYSMGIRPVR